VVGRYLGSRRKSYRSDCSIWEPKVKEGICALKLLLRLEISISLLDLSLFCWKQSKVLRRGDNLSKI